MSLDVFHPAVASWFNKQFSGPTEPQAKAWPEIKQGRHTLIAAPTGSGKTLAAFLSAIDDLVRLGTDGRLDDTTHVVYVSPLKALSNDIQRNLQMPLEGIQRELEAAGAPKFEIRTMVRTGDTPAGERAKMLRRPPHIIVTTPESLYILLTSEGGRRMLQTARTLIVDEIHALVDDKRGSHLSLSVERLEALVGRPLIRVGLSATQKPIEDVARFLTGCANLSPDGTPNCKIVDSGHVRKLELEIELPKSPLEPVTSGEVWEEIYDRLAQLILEHRSTLVFVNTRRLAERVCRHLGERVGDDHITSHHGSLARDKRLKAEQRLKGGELKALVATASLELGIDIGAVDLVCQLGSTRSISTFLQRVGRSGHTLAGVPRGRIFPLTRDELVECAALLDAVKHGELDRLSIPEMPLDILAQQIVAAAAADEWNEDSLYELTTRAYPYRHLTRADFDAVVRMLADGFTTRRGRRSAYIHHDAVNHRLRGRRSARLAAITSGGAIPDTADYAVIQEPGGTPVGTVNEDFAIESMQGDIFQLGNTSWRILRVEPGKVRVEDAAGQPPTIPFWLGEAPGRTAELSSSVSRLRNEISDRLDLAEILSGEDGLASALRTASDWLESRTGLTRPGAEQIAEYMASAKAALGVLPSQQTIVLERFFDESGGAQLVIHSPFGSRLNRAWGLALRKRFCRKFNFELQAAATEDAIVISLGPVHSFPLEEVGRYLRSGTVRAVLIQALLDAPMFAVRWRWNVGRALAVLRFQGGKKIPPQLQRIQAQDLVAAVFPDQMACAENLTGEREIPDHPLVKQTIRDCLEEAMDIDALEAVLRSLEAGEITIVAREMNEPSPLAQEILTARPYAFLDDAPLEERRTQAVISRRWLDPQTAADLGRLDQAAIDRVREESWPQPENADELHDALMQLGFVTEQEGRTGRSPFSVASDYEPSVGAASASFEQMRDDEARGSSTPGWVPLFGQLAANRRAAVLSTAGGTRLWVAAERLPHLHAIYPEALLEPLISTPEAYATHQGVTAEEGLVEVLRGRLEALGPVTTAELARSAGLDNSQIEGGLLGLEAEGFVMRGRFTPESEQTEWCVRRLLSRIQSYTLNRLRKEIEPVSSADFIRYLIDWQRVGADHQAEGPDSLDAIVEQLEGFEAPAGAWEGEILPARVVEYDPAWLDSLCLSGRVVWTRLTPPKPAPDRAKNVGPVRNTPITLLSRRNLGAWNALFAGTESPTVTLSHLAAPVFEHLIHHGASFFAELVEGTGLLRTQVEDALGELVAWGLVTADSFTGLRALLTPSNRRPTGANAPRKHSVAIFGMENAGRWSEVRRKDGLRRAFAEQGSGQGEVRVDRTPSAPAMKDSIDPEHIERVARILLRRYGVVMRRLLDREGLAPPWRELLRVYRRLEARGEVRGGRFVAGCSGEQFALPEAVGMLRTVRRSPKTGVLISVSAADPLNLAGIVTPGNRITSISSNRILFRDGEPIATLESGDVRFLVELSRAAEWEAKNALVRRRVPPQLRAYLGQSA
ncbi:MAG TPA: DEAD/DEAH box helicase [Blastocatellia bacterium]|nr:DEAD/DEAH box helicase [Blastocatellia bacterium]